ncbi:hypothetical protein ES702_04432 [subsurface metagenome]
MFRKSVNYRGLKVIENDKFPRFRASYEIDRTGKPVFLFVTALEPCTGHDLEDAKTRAKAHLKNGN